MRGPNVKWITDLGLGPNPTSKFGAPVSFTASLDSILPGQTQVLSTNGLANGYRTPYLIDEIRMQAYMVAASSTHLQPSNAVKFQFRTGVYAFSVNPVPMILYSPRYGAAPMKSGLYAGLGALTARGPMLAAEYTNGAQIGDEARWVLPKPLWMAPGDQIQCSVERDATAASSGDGAFAVDVTYVGRSLKTGTPGPRTRFVPWVGHFTYDFDDSYDATTTEFLSRFNFPMTIQKFIGRPMSKATSGLFETSGPVGVLPVGTTQEYVSVNIQDSLGYKITNGFTPVGNVFESERCTWTFSRPLGANEQVNMQFQRAGSAVEVNDLLYGVSMIGYREESGR